MSGLDDDERGEYRNGPVTVGDAFHPPEAEQLPGLMSELVEWLRHPSATHPLILAGLTHLNVVSIHPWLNGNGRAARVAGSLMLMRCGVGAPELLNVESEIRGNRDRYFAVLQEKHGPTYQPGEHSATPWLEYFAQICVNCLDARNWLLAALPQDIGVLVMELSRERRAGPEWPAILLSARLAPLRTTRLAEMLGLSPARARAMLSTMAAIGWLLPIGERRGRRYGPSPRLLQLDRELRRSWPQGRIGPPTGAAFGCGLKGRQIRRSGGCSNPSLQPRFGSCPPRSPTDPKNIPKARSSASAICHEQQERRFDDVDPGDHERHDQRQRLAEHPARCSREGCGGQEDEPDASHEHPEVGVQEVAGPGVIRFPMARSRRSGAERTAGAGRR